MNASNGAIDLFSILSFGAIDYFHISCYCSVVELWGYGKCLSTSGTGKMIISSVFFWINFWQLQMSRMVVRNQAPSCASHLPCNEWSQWWSGKRVSPARDQRFGSSREQNFQLSEFVFSLIQQPQVKFGKFNIGPPLVFLQRSFQQGQRPLDSHKPWRVPKINLYSHLPKKPGGSPNFLTCKKQGRGVQINSGRCLFFIFFCRKS